MCGCSGSTPKTTGAPAAPPQRGPGSPGYYWTGPQKRQAVEKKTPKQS